MDKSTERSQAHQSHTDGRSIKNPEQEAEHPSPTQRDQQGKGAQKPHHDLEGQQGGTEGGGRESD